MSISNPAREAEYLKDMNMEQLVKGMQNGTLSQYLALAEITSRKKQQMMAQGNPQDGESLKDKAIREFSGAGIPSLRGRKLAQDYGQNKTPEGSMEPLSRQSITNRPTPPEQQVQRLASGGVVGPTYMNQHVRDGYAEAHLDPWKGERMEVSPLSRGGVVGYAQGGQVQRFADGSEGGIGQTTMGINARRVPVGQKFDEDKEALIEYLRSLGIDYKPPAPTEGGVGEEVIDLGDDTWVGPNTWVGAGDMTGAVPPSGQFTDPSMGYSEVGTQLERANRLGLPTNTVGGASPVLSPMSQYQFSDQHGGFMGDDPKDALKYQTADMPKGGPTGVLPVSPMPFDESVAGTLSRGAAAGDRDLYDLMRSGYSSVREKPLPEGGGLFEFLSESGQLAKDIGNRAGDLTSKGLDYLLQQASSFKTAGGAFMDFASAVKAGFQGNEEEYNEMIRLAQNKLGSAVDVAVGKAEGTPIIQPDLTVLAPPSEAATKAPPSYTLGGEGGVPYRDPITGMPMPAEGALTFALPEDASRPQEGQPQPPSDGSQTSTAGGTGGAGGVGSSSGVYDNIFAEYKAETERLKAEEEKNLWLGVALAGARILGSDSPTLGGAIGEGTAGFLEYLQEDRDKRQEKLWDLQETMMGLKLKQADAIAKAKAGGGGKGGIGETALGIPEISAGENRGLDEAYWLTEYKIGELQNQIERVEANDYLTPEEKSEQIAALQSAKDALAYDLGQTRQTYGFTKRFKNELDLTKPRGPSTDEMYPVAR